MSYNWYSPKRKEDLFWNCLYILASRSVLSPMLVNAMSRSAFLKKNSGYLVLFVKLSWYPELFVIGIRRLVRGQIKPMNVIKVLMSRVFKRTV